jgi:hypothetical protein
MSSLKRFMPSFLKGKTYKYKTQADLANLTYVEIIKLDPNEVDIRVDKNEGGVKLTGDKRDAMITLLAIKRYENDNPRSTLEDREREVNKYLRHKSEVEQLISDTEAKMAAEAVAKLPPVPTARPYSKKGGRKNLNTRRRRASRAKRAIKRSYKMSHKRMQRTRRR